MRMVPEILVQIFGTAQAVGHVGARPYGHANAARLLGQISGGAAKTGHFSHLACG